eukprot:TRINITY_DN10797_c0_g1_i1.p1 TRINITY_DN10797_c0_g1~~TRINITY_DN10797_c0_g1_i1.p1  ORF type:complete len:283 (+),score=63.62 TRINITY_DN10797_c0_g1_i1:93-941(+)
MQMDFFSDGAPQASWESMFSHSEVVIISLGSFDIKIINAHSLDEDFGTGSILWSANVFLARFLHRNARALILPGKAHNFGTMEVRSAAGPKAMELGCGCTALSGLALALAGFRTCVSDVGNVVKTARERLKDYAASVQMQGCKETADAVRAMHAEDFDWFDGAAVARMATTAGVNLVVCADGDYADFLQDALVRASASALAASTAAAAVFCSDGRSASLQWKFQERLKTYFEVEAMEFEDSEFGSDFSVSGSRILVARWRSVEDATATKLLLQGALVSAEGA